MPGKVRAAAARAVAVVATLFWGFLWFGLIDLLVVVTQDEEFHQHYLFESGWGLLYLVLVVVPLVVLVVHPGDAVALAQLGVVTAAVLAGAAWGSALPQLWNGLGLAITVAVLAGLGRGGRVRWRRPDIALSLLAVVGLPAAVAYGDPLARNTTAVEDITNGVSHYPMQASLGLAVVGVTALAAVGRGRVPAWTAAFTSAWLGVESIVYPNLAGSLGTTGGAFAVGWSVLVVVAVELARRQERGAAYLRAAT